MDKPHIIHLDDLTAAVFTSATRVQIHQGPPIGKGEDKVIFLSVEDLAAIIAAAPQTTPEPLPAD